MSTVCILVALLTQNFLLMNKKFFPVLQSKFIVKALQLAILFLVGTGIILGLGISESKYTSLITVQPVLAQRISPSEVWQQVYQQLPDFPKENQYVSKETGKVAENNTLVGRLIRYHVYVKERSPAYRLDWKLTLADYLNANETMYDITYPGHDTLRQNPIEGDRTAIAKLTRSQRNALVQVLTNIFSSSFSATPQP